MSNTTIAQLALVTLCAGCAFAPRLILVEDAPVRVVTTRPELALVFTGGEFGEGTGHILDVLARLGVPASFFVTGDYLAVPEQRAAVPRMLEAGHYVGPHSHAHLLYCAWDDRDHSLITEASFTADLRTNIDALRALGALPEGQRVWFIPPYEWYNREQVAWARRLDISLFNFTPGSGSNRDWIPEGDRGFVPSTEIVEDVLRYERRDPQGLSGFLLLLHLGSARTDKMHLQLEALIEALQERGYSFRRIDALLECATE